MKPLRILFMAIVLTAINSGYSFAFNFQKMTTININGLIVDSKTLLPISGVAIYNDQNDVLGSTNKEGYFDIVLKLSTDGEINFNIKLKKIGYNLYAQKERWENIGSRLSATYYFAMQNSNNKSPAFSELKMGKINTYKDVLKGFNEVKQKVDFEDKIENVKLGNNALFFEINQSYYLINETGWLKLNSPNDTILVNGEKGVPANEINFYVKRSNVKKMSPSTNKNTPFEISTILPN